MTVWIVSVVGVVRFVGTPPDSRVRQVSGCQQPAAMVASGTGRGGHSQERPARQHSQTALHFVVAAAQCNLELCKLIIKNLENNSDKNPENADGITPLHLAAENGHFEVFRLILENATTKNPVAFNGLTPLHSAAKGGYTKIIKLLIANGVDKKPLFNERTPLQLAALNGHVYACLILHKDWEDVIHF